MKLLQEKIDGKISIPNVKALEKKIRSGQKIENRFNVQDKVIFKNKDDVLLGIYELDKGILKTWKNFTN